MFFVRIRIAYNFNTAGNKNVLKTTNSKSECLLQQKLRQQANVRENNFATMQFRTAD
jgi:hypothetical protein